MSRWPAVIRSYDADARQCLVSIPGITDGGDLLAEIEQDLGDRSEDTEIRINEGDRVWVDFIADDTRHPIITGFRAKNRENMKGTRHWEHENLTMNADSTIALEGKDSVTVKGKSIRLEAGDTIELVVGGTSLKMTGAQMAMAASAFNIKGPITHTGGDLISGGVSVQTHPHTSSVPGTPTSPPIKGA